MAGAGEHAEGARADHEIVAIGQPAIGRRQRHRLLQILLAAAEQWLGDICIHAVAMEELPHIDDALFGAAVLVIDALQIFDLRHIEGAVEPLHHPAGLADMIGMRVGDDHLADRFAFQRTFEQLRPCSDGRVIADAGIHHGPAIAVGEQIDVHVVEAEWQVEPDPENARGDFDHLIGPGMVLPGIAEVRT